jgi:N-acetylneuraminic acid mutarotase
VELTPGRKYLRDAYRFDPGRGWTRVKDFPAAVAASPNPAPSGGDGFFVLGGDDGSQVGAPPDKHRGFSRAVTRFDPKTGEWAAAGELPAARVTVPCVVWGGAWVIPSGEARPGVRSPEVWRK